MTIKITSPIEGYSETTYLGSVPLKFEGGSVEVDTLTDAQRLYLVGAGYTVDGETLSTPVSIDGSATPDASEVDSRDLAQPVQVGEPLRDAAVDPQPGDFLEPTNAGKADPHGPDVVSPELHASQGVRPIKGGEVHVDDPAVQDKLETAHADAATDGTPVEPLQSEATTTAPAEQLKGDALDTALKAAGLAVSGTADEKRARLAEHQAKQV